MSNRCNRFGFGIVLALVGVGTALIGGCATGGGNAMTSIGIEGSRMLTATNGQQYSASDLEPLGGQMTLPSGEVALSFAKKQGTWDRIGNGLGRTLISTASGYGGAVGGKAIGGGGIGAATGAVGASTAGNEVYNGVTGAGDPNIIWITRSQLQPQQSASLGIASK